MKSIILLIWLLIFFFVALNLPSFGHDVKDVSQYYLDNSLEETGALNVVAAIVWDYRGYDTLGEVTVMFAAVLGTLSIFGGTKE